MKPAIIRQQILFLVFVMSVLRAQGSWSPVLWGVSFRTPYLTIPWAFFTHTLQGSQRNGDKGLGQVDQGDAFSLTVGIVDFLINQCPDFHMAFGFIEFLTLLVSFSTDIQWNIFYCF